MTPDELASLEVADDRDRDYGFVCGSCGARPTCPMLRGEVWDRIKPEPVRVVPPIRVHAGGRVENRERRGATRCLLCMRCAEARLGRHIELEDLAVCVGNYATAAMVNRRRELLDEALDLLERADSYTDHAETLGEAAARLARASGR